MQATPVLVFGDFYIGAESFEFFEELLIATVDDFDAGSFRRSVGGQGGEHVCYRDR